MSVFADNRLWTICGCLFFFFPPLIRIASFQRADEQTGKRVFPREEKTHQSASPPHRTPPSRPFRPALVQAGRSFQEGLKRAADRRFHRPHTRKADGFLIIEETQAGRTVGQEDDHKLGSGRPSLIKTPLIWALIPILAPGGATKAVKPVFYPSLQVNEAACVTQLG